MLHGLLLYTVGSMAFGLILAPSLSLNSLMSSRREMERRG